MEKINNQEKANDLIKNYFKQKKVDKIKKVLLKTAGTFVWLAIMILMIGGIYVGMTTLYCAKNPSIILDSVCFDLDLTCEFECNEHGQNFTGKWTEHSRCDCGEGEVSICSGAYFPYKPVINNEVNNNGK